MGNKKYYWLKLKEDFFRDKRIKKLRKIAGGDTYTIIYLKMQLLSLKDEGILYYEGVEDDFYEEIALEIDEESDNVKITIMFLIANGLLEEVEKDKYVLLETMKSIGSESSSAARVRRHREKSKALQCNTPVTEGNPSVTNGNTEIEKERELELDIESEKEREKEKEYRLSSSSPSLIDVRFVKIRSFFDENIRTSTFSEHKKMYDLLDDYNDPQLIIEALKLSVERGKPNLNYAAGILNNWKAEYGIITHGDWMVKMSAKSQSDNNKQSIRGNHGKNENSLDGFYKQLERDKQVWGG